MFLSRTVCIAGTMAVLASALFAERRPDVLPSNSPVADAASQDDYATVESLLKQGADVNAAQGDGMTALHWAAIANDAAMAETLLYAGANVRATTRLGAFTPLVFASKLGNGEVVKTLLEAGGEADRATDAGTTPLMLAAASGNEESVSLLISHGADVNARESSGKQTPLMFAAAYDRPSVVNLLLERGADPALATEVIDVPTLNKAIDDAFRARLDGLKQERAEAAGSETPAGAKTNDSTTRAGQSAPSGQIAGSETPDEEAKPKRNIFARLFGWMVPGRGDKDEKPRRRQREPYGSRVGVQGGMTALLLASRQGHTDVVKGLLRGGADVNQVAEGSKTSPLLIAVMNGHFDLARFLLGEGADPTLASEPAGATPLYAAINLAWAPRAAYPQPIAQRQQQSTHLELMQVLLEHGAEPNARLKKKVWFMGYNFDRSSIDETGATPFWRAAYGSDVAAMKLMRAYGGDSKIRTRKPSERPPVANQQAREVKDISGKTPVPVGGPAMTPLHGATGAGYGEGFAANDHRNHPAGFMPAVKYLVEVCGAELNALDHEGNTPLHNAAARGDVEMIRYLIEKGADPTVVNREGQTTADMANGPVQRVSPFPEARDLLVSLGAINNNKCVSC